MLNDKDDGFVEKDIEFVPGLYKIFDEIIVNAADNYQRSRNMTFIEVEIDRPSGRISVKNNGQGIPVEIHKEHKVYVPDMIFGHLLTGSNFNDNEKKVTGGRNGYGAKLANIYSKEFTVECADKQRKKVISIRWKDNMKKDSEVIKPYSGDGDYTLLSFIPDYKLFKMKGLEDDIFELFKKRVYDLAGVVGKKLRVSFNKQKIEIDNFRAYCQYFLQGVTSKG